MEYTIGAEDIVKISVLGMDDLTMTVVVQSDGTFIYPLIGRLKAGLRAFIVEFIADAG